MTRKPHWIARAVSLCALSVCAATAHAAAAKLDQQPVTIDAGALSGELLDAQNGLRVYRGIPYAAPPTGDLRWRAPQPAPRWQGVRQATEFGPACPQLPMLAMLTGEQMAPTSEDCLFLNVWTAGEPSAKRPVMVWIHGGGLSLGWSHQESYDGAAFAQRGVVLVSINYRLGPLGYLAHPLLSSENEQRISGNYGFLDQLAALQWVQRNIEAFGGDPRNVTIFGESAGGTSVHALMASPLGSELFHRAIAQSPWVMETNVRPLRAHGDEKALPPSAEQTGEAWATLMLGEGAKASLAALRALDATKMVQKTGQAGFEPHITIDSHFMPRHSEEQYALGKQNDVPLIAGTNRDEGTMFLAMQPAADRDAFVQQLQATYGELAETVAALYPSSDGAQLAAQRNRFMTDAWFLRATRNMLFGMAKVSSPAFQYHFTRINPVNPAWGAHHAAELGYVFDTLNDEAYTEPDQELADVMIEYWVQFARTGDPNREGLPAWPQFEPQAQRYLEFGDAVQPGEALDRERNDRLEELRRGSAH